MRIFFSELARLLIKFVLTIALAILAYKTLWDKKIAPGEAPSSRFPVIMFVVGTKPPEYRLVEYAALAKARSNDPRLSLQLPSDKGYIIISEYEVAQFSVERLPEELRVRVKHETEDYYFTGQYRVSQEMLFPERLHTGHGFTALAALAIGAIGTTLIFLITSVLVWIRSKRIAHL
jgi:hypothetical protein